MEELRRQEQEAQVGLISLPWNFPDQGPMTQYFNENRPVVSEKKIFEKVLLYLYVKGVVPLIRPLMQISQ